MDKLQIKINRRVKQLEKHLDIKIVYQGEEIDTLFERFSAFSYECADLILFAFEKSMRVKLHYDFNTGNLTDLKTGSEIEMMDLFSCRHLRSLLFIAHETLFLNTTENLSAFITKFHKEYSNPIFCTQTGCEKKWFLIDSIDIVNNSKIYMNGLLSIDNTYTHQPIKAKCVFNIKKEQFAWEYAFNGKKKKEVENENYYSFYKIKMRDILYSYTKYRIDNPDFTEHTPLIQDMVKDMLKVFKKQKIYIFSKKRAGWGNLKSDYICGLFWNLKSVNSDEIVFLACDGDSLYREVIFNRINRKIYASMSGLWRKKMQELEFTHNENGNKDKFYKVIKLIEDRFNGNCQNQYKYEIS